MAIAPIKGNLLNLKRSHALAKTGYEMMDRKRNILIREIMSLMDEASELQSRIDATFSRAYRALQAANITLGMVSEIAGAVPVDDHVQVVYRSVMGVDMPRVRHTEEKVDRFLYGFVSTNRKLDEAFIAFQDVKRLTLQLAQTENSIYLLAAGVKKTQKRANALNNIIIPGFESDIKRIAAALEEKEREEFARLKVIKRDKTERA